MQSRSVLAKKRLAPLRSMASQGLALVRGAFMSPIRPYEPKPGRPPTSHSATCWEQCAHAPKFLEPTSTTTETLTVSGGCTPIKDPTSCARAPRRYVDDPGVQAGADEKFASLTNDLRAQVRVFLDVQGSYGCCDSYVFFRGSGFLAWSTKASAKVVWRK